MKRFKKESIVENFYFNKDQLREKYGLKEDVRVKPIATNSKKEDVRINLNWVGDCCIIIGMTATLVLIMC